MPEERAFRSNATVVAQSSPVHRAITCSCCLGQCSRILHAHRSARRRAAVQLAGWEGLNRDQRASEPMRRLRLGAHKRSATRDCKQSASPPARRPPCRYAEEPRSAESCIFKRKMHLDRKKAPPRFEPTNPQLSMQKLATFQPAPTTQPYRQCKCSFTILYILHALPLHKRRVQIRL